MDPDIRDALGELKGDVKDGFTEVNRRIDHLVTRSEFVAEVRRLDGVDAINSEAIRAVQAALDRHLDQTTELVEATRIADAAIAEKAERGIRDLGDKISRVTKWAVGLALTGLLGAAGTAVAIFSALRAL